MQTIRWVWFRPLRWVWLSAIRELVNNADYKVGVVKCNKGASQ